MSPAKYYILRFITMIRAKAVLTVNPRHYEIALKKRNGKCLMCGECCGPCVNLKVIPPKKICKVYASKNKEGKDYCNWGFPRDEFEQRRMGVLGKCGYWWDKEDRK